MLTKSESERYDRQIIMEEIGEEGQEKLKRAKVFIAGVGGLGCSVSTYLAAAGVGLIRLLDQDRVILSNLNRQVLHWDKDIGKKKVESAAEKLRNFNPDINIEPVAETITEDNAVRFVDGFDLIVDAVDNLPTRHLLNKTALNKNIPLFHGGIYGFEGRATTIIPHKTACLMCMFRGPVPEEKSPVIGVIPAVIGSIQATEVIKYITGIGELLTDRLLMYNGFNLNFTEFKIRKNPSCEHCGRPTKKE
jgi:adenylyltransferase/sulfurtransferase